jgi:hypothetical protein
MISAAMGRALLEAFSLPMFTIGVGLIVVAILLQLLELQFSNRTLTVETEDILAGSTDVAAHETIKASDVPQIK